MKRWLLRFIGEERAQAMAEWVIVTTMLILALAAIFGEFPRIIGRYYLRVAGHLMMPFP